MPRMSSKPTAAVCLKQNNKREGWANVFHHAGALAELDHHLGRLAQKKSANAHKTMGKMNKTRSAFGASARILFKKPKSKPPAPAIKTAGITIMTPTVFS